MVSETQDPGQIQEHLSSIVWSHTGRGAVGFVRVEADSTPSLLGSGTLIRFGAIVGILTCAHVLEALPDDKDVGILCFPVRPTQVQRLRFRMRKRDSLAIGAEPWGEGGPDLAFVRLPESIVGEIESVASIVNGDLHRANIVAGDPEGTVKLCAMAGVIGKWTKPATIEAITDGIIETTTFEALLNVGHVFVDDPNEDRFRFQPVTSEGVILPSTYGGTSGGGLWKFYLTPGTLSLAQARLIGVAYYEKRVANEIHLIGHGQISIYETLLNDIRQKWP
jgi:hypothetical protein